MLHEEVERIKRVVRKKSSSGSGALSFTVTWGTEIPSDAFAFVVDKVWVASTGGGGVNAQDIQISVDGAATIAMFLTQNGVLQDSLPIYGFPIFKTDGSVPSPVITFAASNPGAGTHQMFMIGHWLYAGG